MMAQRIVGALLAAFGITFAIAAPLILDYARSNTGLLNLMARYGTDTNVRFTKWASRLVGLALCTAGCYFAATA
jgi:hypothetical protein